MFKFTDVTASHHSHVLLKTEIVAFYLYVAYVESQKVNNFDDLLALIVCDRV